MNFACVKDGKVENVILASKDVALKIKAENQYEYIVKYENIPGAAPHIGWTFRGKSFLSEDGNTEIIIENIEDIL